jgi:succinoglycan biosynthesis protein ExoO
MPAEVSVIIAAYNIESYVEKAVRSALDQKGAAVEVIVIDDASTDKTLDVISRFDDARLKTIRLKHNSGPGAARNAGIAAAKYPWIAILDGDDVFLPDRLARLLARIGNAKADMAVDNIMVMKETGGTQHPMFSSAWLEQMGLLDLATFIGENRMFQRGHTLGYLKPIFSSAFLKKFDLMYDVSLRIGEDYMLLAEALANGARCAVEPVPGYRYTARKGSTSYRLSLQDIEYISATDEKFQTRHRLNGRALQAQKRRSASLQKAYAYTQLVNAIKQGHIRGIIVAIKLYPTAAFLLWEPIWVRILRIVG